MTTSRTVQYKHRSFGRRLALLAMAALFGGAMAPSAHAQWHVTDETTQGKIDTLQDNMGKTGDGGGKTLNGNLDAINKKLVIGTYKDSQPGKRVDDPKSALPDEGTKLNDGSACSRLPTQQQTNCTKIVEIQNAQYQYMLTMYKNTKTRDDMLRELLKERQAISSDDPNQYGKMEDNTNKLTALYNLIALDQQQMQTVNYAYEANLKFLRDQQAQLSRAANTGRSTGSGISLPGVGDVDLSGALGGLVAGSVLKTALKNGHTGSPTLHVTDQY